LVSGPQLFPQNRTAATGVKADSALTATATGEMHNVSDASKPSAQSQSAKARSGDRGQVLVSAGSAFEVAKHTGKIMEMKLLFQRFCEYNMM
jgi:hypothetical protein